MRLVILVLVWISMAHSAWAETIKTRSRFSDSFPTNVLGTSLTSPPTVQVIRSQKGLDYFLNRFVQYNNLTSRTRIRKLKKQLSSVNYDTHMVITVHSQPMDNYQLKINKINLDGDIIVVNASYKHQMKEYSIPPKKSVFFSMAVVKKMQQPVLLEAKEEVVKSRTKSSQKVTVTGRLMEYTDSTYQLVPVRIKRGKKNSYYIPRSNANLSQYLGKVVTLAGSVSHERNSPYEHDMRVEKLVKAHD